MIPTWGASFGANAILNSAEFRADLTHSLVLDKGTGSPTYTRATTGTVSDNEGILRTAIAGEARFVGARRVRNLWPVSSEDMGVALNTLSGGNSASGDTVTFVGGASTYALRNITGLVAGAKYIVSATITAGSKAGTVNFGNQSNDQYVLITPTVTPTRYSVVISPVGNAFCGLVNADANTGTVILTKVMVENITGRTDQTTPSEYVSVGALDYRSTQDPLYLSLPGTAGHYASTPDSAAASITGDIDIRVKAALADWTPAADTVLLSKVKTLGQYAYDLRVTTTGTLLLVYSTNGTVANSSFSTTSTGITDGETAYIKITRAASSGVIKFYKSADGVTYAQIGTDVVGVSGNLFDGTDTLELGARNGGANGNLSGKVFSAQIYNTIDGTTPVVDFNPQRDATTPTGTITSSTTSEVWTINGASSVVRNATYHGAGIDGVKAFNTSLTGAAIPAATNLGYLAEAAATQILPTADIRDMTTAGWTLGATMTRARTSIGADGAANSATRLTGGAVAATNTCYTTITAAASSRTYSAMVKRVTGTGPVRIVQTGTETDISTQLATTGYALVKLNASVLNVAVGFKIDTNGDAIDVDFNQFEAGTAATSRMVTTGAARVVDVDSVPTAGNITAAAGTIALTYTPTHAPSGTVALWGTYVDASNYTAILHDATNLIFRKRIAGVNTDATIGNAFVSGTTYKMCASWGAAGQTIYLDGTAGTPNANTTAAQIAATMQIGADGNSLQQPGMALKDDRIWQRQLSASEQESITGPLDAAYLLSSPIDSAVVIAAGAPAYSVGAMEIDSVAAGNGSVEVISNWSLT